MSTGTLLPPPATPLAASRPVAPKPKRWTCDEFHRIGDTGAFEGQSLILVDGEILEMPVQNPPHSTAKSLTESALRNVFTTGFAIRTENPLLLGQSTDLVPDIAVVVGSIRDYANAHPTTATLIVEIADSSLDYDTSDKASLYASADIADYWVVDLVNRRVLIFRNPQVDSTKPFGFTYVSVSQHLPGQSVTPLSAPSTNVQVSDLLP